MMMVMMMNDMMMMMIDDDGDGDAWPGVASRCALTASPGPGGVLGARVPVDRLELVFGVLLTSISISMRRACVFFIFFLSSRNATGLSPRRAPYLALPPPLPPGAIEIIRPYFLKKESGRPASAAQPAAAQPAANFNFRRVPLARVFC